MIKLKRYRLWISLVLLVMAASVNAASVVNIPSKPIPLKNNFTLLDKDKKPFDISGFKNHWTFLMMGYTSCPDVCPNGLYQLKRTYNKLTKDEKNTDLQIVFISVDPDRDTPDKLKEYLSYYHSSLVGVTGSVDQIEQLITQFNYQYTFNDPDEATGFYTMSHSDSVILINPAAQIVAEIRSPFTDTSLEQAFKALTSSTPQRERDSRRLTPP